MMKRCKQKSQGHQVLRSSKKFHQKNPDDKDAALDTSSSSTAVPQRPPASKTRLENTLKTNFHSDHSYSVKNLCPVPKIKNVEESDVFKKTPLSQSMLKSDSELPLKEIKVKQEKLSPTIDRKKHWKLTYLESSQKEWQLAEVTHPEHNYNNETNSDNNGSKNSVKKEYDPTHSPQSVPTRKSPRNHNLSNSDIYPANRRVLNSPMPNITDYSSTCMDLSKLVSQNNSLYPQNNNISQTSCVNDKILQGTSPKTLETISTQTQNNTDKQLSQAPLECIKSTVNNNENLEIPNYMHNDPCLKSKSHPEVIQTLPQIEKMWFPIQTQSPQDYDSFMTTEPFGHKQHYNNFVPQNTSHDFHAPMMMGPPRPPQPNIPSYLYRRPEITYDNSMESYPYQPIPQSSAICWGQNQPVHENGTIPELMTQVSDSNLMPGHLIQNQPQGGYFMHSILQSPAAPFPVIPNQGPPQMGSTLSNVTTNTHPKETMIRMPVDRLPESFISTAETSAFSNNSSLECYNFNPGNNKNYPQVTQLLEKNTNLVDCNRENAIFHDFQIPKSINGVIKGLFILQNYIDFLIWENEAITEMSQEYTPPTPLYTFAEDQYILKAAAADDALFPTSKFERFIEIHFPSIDLRMVDFEKCKGSICIPRKLDTDVDKVKDVFFYFQNLRGTNNMMDTEISDNNIAGIELSFTKASQKH